MGFLRRSPKLSDFAYAAGRAWTDAECIVTTIGDWKDAINIRIPAFALKDREIVAIGRRVVLGKRQLEFIVTRMPFLRVAVLREFCE